MRNLPTTKVDADGHCFWDLCIGEAIVVGITAGEVFAAASTGALIGASAGAAAKGGSPQSCYGPCSGDGPLPGTPSWNRMMADTEKQRQANNQSSSTTKDAPADPNKPGTLGKPDHQETVKEEAERIKGKPEVTIKTPGGNKESRRADAAQTDGKGNYKPGGKIVQVIRPTPAGNVPKREQQAAQDLHNATGVKPELVPVRPKQKD